MAKVSADELLSADTKGMDKAALEKHVDALAELRTKVRLAQNDAQARLELASVDLSPAARQILVEGSLTSKGDKS